ncbi:MAG: NAD-dependent epimerase/dehydratase family protein [Actinobacteria bacterium]|nr:NAD-dependent epimerase/dehydratase family protein [Actinomycetota bacterium]
MVKRKVLVTGAAGYIAAQVLPAFRDRYDCTLADVRSADRDGRTVPGVRAVDLLADMATLRPLFTGQDAVVHLAFMRTTPDRREHFNGELDNIRMAYHVFRLSLDEGVRRVVVASSNHAADFYEPRLLAREMEMLAPTNDIRPLSDNYYGWAKESYEHLGFVFAAGRLGRRLENVHIRIGAPRPIELAALRGDAEGYAYRRNLGAYISPRDLTQLFVKSIETEQIENEWGIPWQVFYGISNNTRAFWSLANARRVIGYEPEDDSEVTWAKDIYANLTGQGVKGRVGPGS